MLAVEVGDGELLVADILRRIAARHGLPERLCHDGLSKIEVADLDIAHHSSLDELHIEGDSQDVEGQSVFVGLGDFEVGRYLHLRPGFRYRGGCRGRIDRGPTVHAEFGSCREYGTAILAFLFGRFLPCATLRTEQGVFVQHRSAILTFLGHGNLTFS